MITKKPTYEELEKKIKEFEKLAAERDRIEQALKESEERYRLLAENVTDVIWVRDENLNFSYISPSIEGLSGYTPEEAMKQSFADQLTPASMEVAIKVFEEYLTAFFETPSNSRIPLTMELENIRKDGSTGWTEMNMAFLRNQDNTFKGIVGVSRDITDRKRAEATLQRHHDHLEELVSERTDDLKKTNEKLQKEIIEHKRTAVSLQESERLSRAILDHTFQFIGLMDCDGTLIKANQAALGFKGIKESDVLGRPFWETIWWTHSPELQKQLQEAISRAAAGEFIRFEAFHPDSDGELHYLDVSIKPVQDETGKVVFLIPEGRDITERKRAETELSISETNYRSIFNTVSDAIAVIEMETGEIIDVNQKMCEMYGYSAVELVRLGGGLLGVDSPYSLIEAQQWMQKAIEGQPQFVEWQIKDRNGRLIWVEINLKRAVIGGQERLLAVLHDISARKQMEEELFRIQSLESLGTLAGGIAHDFNNILTSIMTNISMARLYGELPTDIYKMLVDAEAATMRAANLAQQLLTFAKGGAPITKTVNMSKLIKEITAFALSGSNVSSEYTMPDDLLFVEVDEGQISQVIQNIVINADQAMPEGGIVRVNAENISFGENDHLKLKAGKYIKLSIADQGCGIAKKQLMKIFDPFYTTKEKGRGLGLAISFSIVNRHDGYIYAESEAGQGTTFHIFLPASKEKIIVENSETEALRTGTGKILIIDDERIIRDSVNKILAQLGYEVQSACSGEEGVKRYEEARQQGQPFSVVIMDLTIPGGMGGKEAVREFKRIDPQAKVIVSSGYSNDPVMSEYRQYGFCGILPKPYNSKNLGEVLHKILVGDT